MTVEVPAGWTNRIRQHRDELWWSLVVAAALGVAYWFTQWILPGALSSHPDISFYLVRPAIWIAVGGLAVWRWTRLDDAPPVSRLLIGIAFLVGIFHLALLVIAGVLWDFGDSPIAGRLINYPKNLWYFGTVLAGVEAARAYLYRVWQRVDRRIAFGAVAAAFFAVTIPAAQWSPFESANRAFEVVGGRWVPALALSLLATWLVRIGGIGPSFAYRFVLVAFQWFSPILPDLDWTVLFIVGVVAPSISVLLIRALWEDTPEGAAALAVETRGGTEPDEDEDDEPVPAWRKWSGWVATAAAVLAVILFANGVFGYQLRIIDGISMEPAYSRGDIAVVRDSVDPASLQVNDVVLFHDGRIPVVHRIIEIDDSGPELVFTTKGDNVAQPDRPIAAADVEGKVVFLIPELGTVNLWIRGR